MRARAALAAIAVALVVAGCGDDDATPATTTTTTAPAGTSSTVGPAGPTTTEPNGEPLELRGDGLGVTELGATPADAISAVTSALGAPTTDTGWGPSSAYATCPGDQVRFVEWDGLQLGFTDGETPAGRGEHLFAWRVHDEPPTIATALGLGVGDSFADANALYPGLVQRTPDASGGPDVLTILAPGGVISALLDDADAISVLDVEGAACGG